MTENYKNTPEGMIKRADIVGKMTGMAANATDLELGQLFGMVYEFTLASADSPIEREFGTIALRDIASEMAQRGLIAA